MNKHLRKICLLTVGVLLLSVLFCFSVSAVQTEGIYSYNVSGGEATIMKVSSSASGELTTPKTLGGYPVTAINGFAFDGCTSLTKVTVSEGVESLGYGTFNGCSNLASIILPDSVTTVEYEAVSSTKWYSLQPTGIVYLNGVVIGYKGSMPISDITFKAGTKAVASGAFKDQTNIMSVTFPEGFEAVGTEAFSGCFNIKTVNFPDSLKKINAMAFSGCTKLTSVTIPESLTEIGFYAFENCTALTEVIFDATNEIKDSSGFFGCNNINTVRFSKTAKSLAPSAISGGALKTFTADSENTAFTVDTDGVLLSKDKTELIKYPTGNSRISYTVPSTVKVIRKDAFKNSSYLSIVNIPSSVETVEEKAFENASSLTTVKFEKGVKSIGDYAFSGCDGLSNITLPEGIEYLGQHVFDGASKLQNIVLPEGLTEVPDFAFFDCTNLKSVTIPDSVKRIGWSSFNGCTSFMNITLPESVTEVTQYAFDNTGWYNSLSESSAGYIGDILYKYKGEAATNSTFTVKDGTRLIANGAFAYGDKILKVVMPSSVKAIGEEAFCGNTNLTYVTFGSATESIGDRAFFSCPKLSTLSFPASLKTIGEEAFRLCSALSVVSFGKGLEYIGVGAFDLCAVKSYSIDSANTNLTAENGVIFSKDKTVLHLYPNANAATSYSIPVGVKEISSNAFYSAENLKTISFPDSLAKIGKDAFEFCAWYDNRSDGVVYAGKVLYKYKGDASENTTVNVNSGTVGIAQEAFTGKENITKISVPDSVKYIGENAFERTGWLEAQPDGVVMAGKVVYSYKGDMPENTKLEIKDATAIADNAFKDSENLEEVILGESVEVLGKDAFAGCSNLNKVSFENAQCEIHPSSDTIPESATISAPPNSTAQQYAQSQDREYDTYCHHENTKTVEAVSPTCTAEGYTAGVYCNDCEKYISGHEAVAVKGHTEAVVPAVEATCKNTGLTAGTKCSVCGIVLKAQTVTEKKAHTEEKIAYKAPTCTETGLTEGKKCSVCAEILEAQTVIPSIGHSVYTVFGKEATCTESGLTDGEKCSVCGAFTKEQKMIPMAGHSEYIVFGKEATCTEAGLTDGKKCSNCNEFTTVQKTIPALGHKFEAVGEKKICSVCKFTIDGNHTHKEVVLPAVAATCTETGLTSGKKCSVCGEILTAQKETPALGHKFEAIGDKKVCSVCKFTVDSTHTHTVAILPAVAATCTRTGLAEGKMCITCGEILIKQTDIPLKAHTEAILPGKSATYKATGLTEGKKCSVCGTVTVAQKKVARKKLKKVTSLKVKSVTTSTVKLSWKKVTGAESYKVYYSTNGKKWKSVKTAKTTLTVKKLSSGTSYQFKVKAFAGKYYGTVSSVVKTATKVKKVTLKSVKSSKKAQATVSWNKVTGASGYVVEYSTSKKFTKKTTKKATLKKGASKKTTLKKLKRGKKYYVRVRAYKTVNGKAVYGAYSSVKTVKVK